MTIRALQLSAVADVGARLVAGGEIATSMFLQHLLI